MARFRGHPGIRALGLRRCQMPWPGCAKRPALGRERLSEGGRGGLAPTSESEPCRALQVGPGLTRGSGRRVRALPRHARHDAATARAWTSGRTGPGRRMPPAHFTCGPQAGNAPGTALPLFGI